MPLEATQHTPEGAKAFAEFFIKTIDWGYATTSSAYMRHYFTKSCLECSNAASALDRAARLHRHFVGDRFSIKSASPARRSSTIRVTFDVSSGEVVDRHDHFLSGDTSHPGYREDIAVSWAGQSWMVRKMVPHP
ncbi:MAG TPA: DUF6318 family protein [Jatrophihabitantaceae bacterium]|jgi:hypothetical protein|nr:DUF6318 family protein [Jatrophihabitantaceae bacterium]